MTFMFGLFGLTIMFGMVVKIGKHPIAMMALTKAAYSA